MTLKVVSIVQGFADHSANEPEELQVVGVDVRVSIRMEGSSITAEGEKSVVGVEHLFTEFDEEVSDETSRVNSSFALEVNVKWLLKFCSAHVVNLVERVHEDFLAINFHPLLLSISISLPELFGEVSSLVIEVK